MSRRSWKVAEASRNLIGITARSRKRMQHANETKFWERLLKTTNPDWDVGFAEEVGTPGTVNLAEQRVRIYIVDTSNMWTLAGATTELAAVNAHHRTSANPREASHIVGSIGHLLTDLSDRGMDRGSVDAIKAIQCSLIAISTTRTFSEAKRLTGGYSGHWAYLLYRMNDGQALTRPVYVSNDTSHAFMETSTLGNVVSKVVALDLYGTRETSISRQVAQGRGVQLHESFSRRLP